MDSDVKSSCCTTNKWFVPGGLSAAVHCSMHDVDWCVKKILLESDRTWLLTTCSDMCWVWPLTRKSRWSREAGGQRSGRWASDIWSGEHGGRRGESSSPEDKDLVLTKFYRQSRPKTTNWSRQNMSQELFWWFGWWLSAAHRRRNSTETHENTFLLFPQSCANTTPHGGEPKKRNANL